MVGPASCALAGLLWRSKRALMASGADRLGALLLSRHLGSCAQFSGRLSSGQKESSQSHLTYSDNAGGHATRRQQRGFSSLPNPGLTAAPGVPSSSSSHVGATTLDGRMVAQEWLKEIAVDAEDVKFQINRAPALAVVLVGTRADSVLYVNRKRQAAAKVGIDFHLIQLPEKVTQQRLLKELDALYMDSSVDGVIVQLPLPRHIDEESVLEYIHPMKDVDGFHPVNVGRLAMRGVVPAFVPCTPLGSVQLLRRYGVAIEGKRVVILGNSNTVGIPLSMLLRDEGAAAVTVCHCTAMDFQNLREEARPRPRSEHYIEDQDGSVRALADACLPPLPAGGGSSGGGKRSLPASCIASIPEVTREADILFVAIGQAELVRKEWVKEGCVVVDIGINARPTNKGDCMDELAKKMLDSGCPPPDDKVEIVGDVAFQEVSQVASYISPVPGGQGPMTIAALCFNTVLSAKRHMKILNQRNITNNL